MDDTCGRCQFYLDKARLLGKEPADHVTRGECRRFPPSGGAAWPWVESSDWCGEFKVRS